MKARSPRAPTRVLAQTPAYDHCNFTVLDGAPREPVARFRELLLGMSYARCRACARCSISKG